MLTLRGEHFYFTENIRVIFKNEVSERSEGRFRRTLGPRNFFRKPWRAAFGVELALCWGWRSSRVRKTGVAVGMPVARHPPHGPVRALISAHGSYLGCAGQNRSNCQRRLKIPHFAGRKFPSPRQVVVDCFGRWVQYGFRPVKRRRALLESNPPRNSRPETHRGRWEGRGVKTAPIIVARGRPTGGGTRLQAEDGFHSHIGPIDLVMPQKTHNEAPRFPRWFGAPAAGGARVAAPTC